MRNLQTSKSFIIIALAIPLFIVAISINVIFTITALDSLNDFGSFVASGQFYNQGENPYSNDSPLVFSVKFANINLEGDAPNLNPPISVIIFKSIASIPPLLSINIWRICSIIIFIISLLILNRTYPIEKSQSRLRAVWALGLAGFWHTLQLGQIYTLLLFFTVLVWIFLKSKHELIAGIFLGILIAIKPNFIFWAFLLLVGGNWKTFLSAGFSAATISAIPLFTDGFIIYQQWLTASSLFTPNLLLFPGNNSFQGLTSRVGYVNIGIILSAIVAFVISLHVLRTKPAVSIVNRLGVIVSLLISPIAWTGYILMVLPIFFEQQQIKWDIILSSVIFSIPVMFSLVLFQTNFTSFIIFGWLYGWGLLFLLYGVFFDSCILKDKVAAIIKSIQTN